LDVFSWFRQKRQGIRPVPHGEILIPVEATPTFGLVVYGNLGTNPPPDEDELLGYGRRWAEAHATEPLRSGIIDFVDQGLINLFIHDRAGMPEPPDDVLRAYNPGETEERRFRNAANAIVIGSPDLLVAPRIGLWSVMAVARGIASQIQGGVIVDPEFPRLLSLDSLGEDLPEDGVVYVADHILIPYSSDAKTGLLWITTKGMARFGLPEIEIHDAPPNLAGSLMPVLNGLAQRLVACAMDLVTDSVAADATPDALPLRTPFRLSMRDIRSAYNDPERVGGETKGEGSATIRLEVVERERGGPFFVRVAPPKGIRADVGVWLNRLLTDLLGSDPQIESIETGDERMERAHQQAVIEIPLVRARFQSGFRSGEVLHVKYGFPTDDEGREFMWIAVTTWEEDRLRGTIANDPQYRRDLHAGQTVEVVENEIYDWMIAHTDGRIEGAFTNLALQDQEEVDDPGAGAD
jgi:uncharacterized protein YegJ (DUF2314 family)